MGSAEVRLLSGLKVRSGSFVFTLNLSFPPIYIDGGPMVTRYRTLRGTPCSNFSWCSSYGRQAKLSNRPGGCFA